MSNPQAAPVAPGSPTGRKMTDTSKAPGAPARKKKSLKPRLTKGKASRNLFDDGAFGMEGSTQKPSAGGRRRRRRKSKRKSRRKSHKKRRTKKRRKSRKKRTKRRRRRR